MADPNSTNRGCAAVYGALYSVAVACAGANDGMAFVLPVILRSPRMLLRTGFQSDSAWNALCEAIEQPSEEGFTASLKRVSDPAFNGLSIERLLASVLHGGDRVVAFLADRTTLADPERPILVVNLQDEPGRMFRVIPREVWSVENNLSIASMDYRDFADGLGPYGVFRGFPPP